MFLFCICVLSALFSVTAGQDTVNIIDTLPTCAQVCTIPVVLSLPCNTTTLISLSNCICTNVTAERAISKCVQQHCNITEQLVVAKANSALCVGQPEESRVKPVLLSIYICSAIVFPLVILRLWSRVSIAKKLGLDDALIIVATLSLGAGVGLSVSLTQRGFGKHLWNVNLDNVSLLFKLFYSVELVYIVVQVFVKISILVFYLRIFLQRWFRWVCFAIITFLISHGIAFFLVIVFQCLPVSSLWDQAIEGKCLDTRTVIFTGAAFSIVEDVAILALPIPCLVKLNVGKAKRFNSVVMFSIGSFACIASMIRLKHLTDSGDQTDPTFDNADVAIWSTIEINLAVICAVLPALRPLLDQLFPTLFAGSSSPNPSHPNLPHISATNYKSGTSKVNTLHAHIGHHKGTILRGSGGGVMSPKLNTPCSTPDIQEEWQREASLEQERASSAGADSTEMIIIMKPRYSQGFQPSQNSPVNDYQEGLESYGRAASRDGDAPDVYQNLDRRDNRPTYRIFPSPPELMTNTGEMSGVVAFGLQSGHESKIGIGGSNTNKSRVNRVSGTDKDLPSIPDGGYRNGQSWFHSSSFRSIEAE